MFDASILGFDSSQSFVPSFSFSSRMREVAAAAPSAATALNPLIPVRKSRRSMAMLRASLPDELKFLNRRGLGGSQRTFPAPHHFFPLRTPASSAVNNHAVNPKSLAAVPPRTLACSPADK